MIWMMAVFETCACDGGVLQAAQEEMESTDAQRKARFAKMQTKYDAQLCASQHPIWLTQLRASD